MTDVFMQITLTWHNESKSLIDSQTIANCEKFWHTIAKKMRIHW